MLDTRNREIRGAVLLVARPKWNDKNHRGLVTTQVLCEMTTINVNSRNQIAVGTLTHCYCYANQAGFSV